MKITQSFPLAVVLLTGALVWAQPIRIPLSIEGASFEQTGFPASGSIDYSQTTGWAINPNEENPNYIQYGVGDQEPGIYQIRMAFNFGTYHVMETFTLSWSANNGVTWHPLTDYDLLETTSGAAISVDASGTITTGIADRDQYTLTAYLGRITDLRIDTPANASHRGSGIYLNENYVLNDFTLSYVSAPPQPIHSWAFDEGSGSTAADAAGGADATVNGATWAVDRFGNDGMAIQTGYNKWVDPPDSVKTGTGTFAAWIYAEAHGGFNQPAGPVFSAEQGSGASNFAYRLQLNESGVIAFEAVAPWGVSGSRVAVSESTVPLNTWIHVAGTYDGYTTRVYINGQLDGSSQTYETFAGMNINPSIRVGIGHLANWSVQWFQGRIDDARVYDSALSNFQLMELASQWNGYFPGEDGWVDTGDWLGWCYVHYDPWIWVHDLNRYLYLDSTGWIHMAK
jgi:hypothetical protein